MRAYEVFLYGARARVCVCVCVRARRAILLDHQGSHKQQGVVWLGKAIEIEEPPFLQ